MWSPRRIVGGVVIFIALLLLLRHTTTAASSRPQGPISDTSADSSPQITRAYPPPPPTSKSESDQKPIHDVTSLPLRERLEYYFPYNLPTFFPASIWQTWRVSPSSGAFESHLRPLEASWSTKHPTFIHEVITDDTASHLIKYLFASVPEVWHAYDAMPLPVLRADFFRYLILLARGGIYSDIDTEALKPATEWLPPAIDKRTVGLVVGIEADPDRDDWQQWYARRIQFCQWTIQAKAGHPVLREIVAHIVETTLLLQRRDDLKRGRVPASVSIMDYTGPGVWSDTIFGYLNDRRYFDFSAPDARNISATEFFKIKEPHRIGDVVVLPITSFSPGVGQMGAGDVDDPMAFVKHEFEGSWKPESERHIQP